MRMVRDVESLDGLKITTGSTKVNSKMTSATGSAEFYIRHSIILATGRTIDSMVGESR